MYYRAIKLNIKLYRWDRAVQLVKKFKVHADTLLAYRDRYLKSMDSDEKKEIFIQLRKHVGEYSWDAIKAKIQEEKAQEKKE
jgi:intraflagellar transport protein 80